MKRAYAIFLFLVYAAVSSATPVLLNTCIGKCAQAFHFSFDDESPAPECNEKEVSVSAMQEHSVETSSLRIKKTSQPKSRYDSGFHPVHTFSARSEKKFPDRKTHVDATPVYIKHCVFRI